MSLHRTLEGAIEAARDEVGPGRKVVRRFVTTDERSPDACSACGNGDACRQEVTEYDDEQRIIVHLPGS